MDIIPVNIQNLEDDRAFYLGSGVKLGRSTGRSDMRKRVRKCSEIIITASLLPWGSCWMRYFIASTNSRCPSTYRGSGFRGLAFRRAGSGISGLIGRVRTLAMLTTSKIPTYSDACSALYAVIPAGIRMEAGPASSFVFPLANPRYLDSTPPTRLHAINFLFIVALPS